MPASLVQVRGALTPTNKYKRKTAGIEDYQFKAAEFPGKC